MNKLTGFSGMKSLDQLRSLSDSLSEKIGRSIIMPASQSSPEFSSFGSFDNLKLISEKLVKEQASVKTDLDMANSKLKKSVDHIHSLEEKLQIAIKVNATLQLKQKEDAKLWKGLVSRFSSTKTLYDQLTETLQYLAGQVRDAEQDKKLFEDNLCACSEAFDSLNLQMSGLSLKLESAEEYMRNSEKELWELKIEKEDRQKFYMDENFRTIKLIGEKVKDLEEAVAADKLGLQSLNSQLEEVQRELSLKEDMCKWLIDAQKNLEKVKSTLQLSNEDFVRRILALGQEIEGLEDLVHELVEKFIEFDELKSMVSEYVTDLNHAIDTCYNFVQQEKDLIAKHAELQFCRLNDQLLRNDAFLIEIEELKSKNVEQHKLQELVMARDAENRSVEQKVTEIGSEAETLASKKRELKKTLTNLEERIEGLMEILKISESKMIRLHITVIELEQHIASVQNQVFELWGSIEEKLQLHQQSKIRASMAAAETMLAETKRQHDLMLESKQLELDRNFKGMYQMKDQAINDIRRKFELEKVEQQKMQQFYHKEHADLIRQIMNPNAQDVNDQVEWEGNEDGDGDGDGEGEGDGGGGGGGGGGEDGDGDGGGGGGEDEEEDEDEDEDKDEDEDEDEEESEVGDTDEEHVIDPDDDVVMDPMMVMRLVMMWRVQMSINGGDSNRGGG